MLSLLRAVIFIMIFKYLRNGCKLLGPILRFSWGIVGEGRGIYWFLYLMGPAGWAFAVSVDWWRLAMESFLTVVLVSGGGMTCVMARLLSFDWALELVMVLS